MFVGVIATLALGARSIARAQTEPSWSSPSLRSETVVGPNGAVPCAICPAAPGPADITTAAQAATTPVTSLLSLMVVSLRSNNVPAARAALSNSAQARWRRGFTIGVGGVMGDKGQKDKNKDQKQHAAKDKQEEKKKLERQPKRTP